MLRTKRFIINATFFCKKHRCALFITNGICFWRANDSWCLKLLEINRELLAQSLSGIGAAARTQAAVRAISSSETLPLHSHITPTLKRHVKYLKPYGWNVQLYFQNYVNCEMPKTKRRRRAISLTGNAADGNVIFLTNELTRTLSAHSTNPPGILIKTTSFKVNGNFSGSFNLGQSLISNSLRRGMVPSIRFYSSKFSDIHSFKTRSWGNSSARHVISFPKLELRKSLRQFR